MILSIFFPSYIFNFEQIPIIHVFSRLTTNTILGILTYNTRHNSEWGSGSANKIPKPFVVF